MALFPGANFVFIAFQPCLHLRRTLMDMIGLARMPILSCRTIAIMMQCLHYYTMRGYAPSAYRLVSSCRGSRR